MIRIGIADAAFEAIAQTLPLGSVAVEPEANERGERHVWLALTGSTASRPCAGRGELFSDVILRLVESEARR